MTISDGGEIVSSRCMDARMPMCCVSMLASRAIAMVASPLPPGKAQKVPRANPLAVVRVFERANPSVLTR